jgi:hypothetical protein
MKQSTTENSTTTHAQSEFNVLFVHSRVDDFGLTLRQFRVYCHLARRAGSGVAFPGRRSIAKVTKMSKTSAVQAIRDLESLKLLEVTRTDGHTTHYHLTAPSKWSTGPNERTVASRTGPIRGTPWTNPGNGTGPIQGTKGNPIKEIQEGNPNLSLFSSSASSLGEYRGVRAKFEKPTAEAVRLQCAKIGLPESEAEKFWNYHESKGWVVGRAPMKNWHAALQTWKSNSSLYRSANHTNRPRPDHSKGFFE